MVLFLLIVLYAIMVVEMGGLMKIISLSDVRPFRVLFLSVSDITNYVFTSNNIEVNYKRTYDVALVLGCSDYDIMKHRVDEAIKLYRRGLFKKIVLTGGVGYFSTKRHSSEASIMKDYMIINGVLEEDILVEDCSRDTYENVKNSVKIIENEFNKSANVILITSSFHIKRAKAILDKLSSLKVYSYGVLDGKHDIDNWYMNTFSSRRLIKTEAFLLSWYVRKGLIIDQKILERGKHE